MSALFIMPEKEPSHQILFTRELAQIRSSLTDVGVHFEQWQSPHSSTAGMNEEEILSAWRSDLDRLMQSGSYCRADVVRITPDTSMVEMARRKFLAEHTHSEDELRFFVEGRGLFYLRLKEKVYCALCEAGDLIGVPAGTRHWFDMGSRPHFTAIRIFGTEEGWVAAFTGDPIASSFPDFDVLAGP